MRARGLKMVLLGLVALIVFSALVMLLWNWLIPSIFGLTAINFWQALGLLALSRILFGGLGRGHGMMNMMHHHKNPIHDKWMKMTDEQRREFIHRRHRFGFGDQFGKSNSENEHEERQ